MTLPKGRVTRRHDTARQPNGEAQARVEEWFEAGYEGTTRDVAEALGLSKKTVFGVLHRLAELGELAVLRQEPRAGRGRGHPVQMANIWGRVNGTGRPRAPSIVAVALAHRLPLEVAWGARA